MERTTGFAPAPGWLVRVYVSGEGHAYRRTVRFLMVLIEGAEARTALAASGRRELAPGPLLAGVPMVRAERANWVLYSSRWM